MADKTTANPTMWLNKGPSSRRDLSMDSVGSKGPRMFKRTSLILLAVSPFLAYVLLLPKDPPASVPFKGSASLQSRPAPSISPSPFVAIPVPEVSSEPLSPETSPSATAKQLVNRPTPSPAPPAPAAAVPAPEPSPIEESPLPGNDSSVAPGGAFPCVEIDAPGCVGSKSPTIAEPVSRRTPRDAAQASPTPQASNGPSGSNG